MSLGIDALASTVKDIMDTRPPKSEDPSWPELRAAQMGMALILVLGVITAASLDSNLGLAQVAHAAGKPDAGYVRLREDHPPSARASVIESARPQDNSDVIPADLPAPLRSIPGQLAVDGPQEATLLFVGDVMVGRQVNYISQERGDFTWPFDETVDFLHGADLTFGNLESPLVTGCPSAGTGMKLCGDPRAAPVLAWAGFSGLGVANNHSHDYGDTGYADTLDYLERAGVTPITSDALIVRTSGGIRIGIIAFEDTYTHSLDLEKALSVVRRYASQVDILIGMLHWGDEYHDIPSVEQKKTGRALIDAGMKVIIGAHPHWTQPVEEYGGGLIFYSLGNFVFDQMWSDRTRQGEATRLILRSSEGRISIRYELIAVEIIDYGQPSLVTLADQRPSAGLLQTGAK